MIGQLARWALVAFVVATPARGAPPPSPQDKPPPIEVQTDQDLRVGTLARVAGGGGWTAVDPETGARQFGGGVYGLGGDYGPAEFEVRGQPDAQFTVRLPGRLRLDRGLELCDFVSVPEGTGILDSSGRARVVVGATLLLDAEAGAGFRSAPFSVRVEYL